MLYTPLQLFFGIPFHVAVVQSLWFTMLTALSAVLLFRKEQQVDWKLSISLESASFAGAFASGYFARLFTPQVLTAGLAALLLCSGIVMLLELAPPLLSDKISRFEWVRHRAGEVYRVHLGKGLPLSFLIGITSGLTGTAGGYLKIPMLVRLFGVPIKVAFGSSAFMVILTSAGGLLGHISTGEVAWHHPIVLGAFVLAGSQIGPRLALRSEPETMRKRFSGYLFAIAFALLASLMFAAPGGATGP